MSDDIKFMLGEITTTLKNIEKHLDDLNGRLDHHSNRLGSLERWRATIVGAAAIAGVGLGAFFKKLFS